MIRDFEGRVQNARGSLIFVLATKHADNQVIRNRSVNLKADRFHLRTIRAEGVHKRNRNGKELLPGIPCKAAIFCKALRVRNALRFNACGSCSGPYERVRRSMSR
jgi:hypothetical protein